MSIFDEAKQQLDQFRINQENNAKLIITIADSSRVISEAQKSFLGWIDIANQVLKNHNETIQGEMNNTSQVLVDLKNQLTLLQDSIGTEIDVTKQALNALYLSTESTLNQEIEKIFVSLSSAQHELRCELDNIQHSNKSLYLLAETTLSNEITKVSDALSVVTRGTGEELEKIRQANDAIITSTTASIKQEVSRVFNEINAAEEQAKVTYNRFNVQYSDFWNSMTKYLQGVFMGEISTRISLDVSKVLDESIKVLDVDFSRNLLSLRTLVQSDKETMTEYIQMMQKNHEKIFAEIENGKRVISEAGSFTAREIINAGTAFECAMAGNKQDIVGMLNSTAAFLSKTTLDINSHFNDEFAKNVMDAAIASFDRKVAAYHADIGHYAKQAESLQGKSLEIFEETTKLLSAFTDESKQITDSIKTEMQNQISREQKIQKKRTITNIVIIGLLTLSCVLTVLVLFS